MAVTYNKHWALNKGIVNPNSVVITFADKSGLSVRSSVLYCGVRRFLHGSEMWIFIGIEFDSNFSVRATFRPKRQYLKKYNKTSRRILEIRIKISIVSNRA